MKTTRLLGIIVISVLILLVFSFIPISDNDLARSQGAQAISSISEDNDTLQIVDLIGQEGSYMCTVSFEDGEIESQGVIYLKDGTFRADFETTITELEITIDTHSIWDGQTVYSWSSASEFGTRAPASLENVVRSTNSDVWDYDGYVCNEARVPSQVFVLPDGVDFEVL